jgi:tRNA A37 threonylcarbamoyladenosine dehydratase
MLYDRQKALQLRTPSITVVGCGGIGFWVGKFCAMAGIETIHLFDPDTIEDHNRNRLDLTEKAIGVNKAQVLKDLIVELRPEVSCYAMPFKYQEHLAKKTDWVIDCTDLSKSQEENLKIAKKFGSKYVKAGYDGEHISINNNLAEWGVAEDGYTVIPSWVVPAVIVAALTVAKIMKYDKEEISTTIQRLFSLKH